MILKNFSRNSAIKFDHSAHRNKAGEITKIENLSAKSPTIYSLDSQSKKSIEEIRVDPHSLEVMTRPFFKSSGEKVDSIRSLVKAVKSGNVDAVAALVERNPDIASELKLENFPIYQLEVLAKRSEMVSALANLGADISSINRFLKT